MAVVALDDDPYRRGTQAPVNTTLPVGQPVRYDGTASAWGTAPQSLFTGRDDLLRQFQQLYAPFRPSLGPDELGDFENLFRQSAEASVPGGAGLDAARPFASLLQDYAPRVAQRFAPTASNGGTGGDADPGLMRSIAQAQSGSPASAATSLPTTQPGVSIPGAQFDDPYTTLFEDTAKQYLERLTGVNPELQRLMDYIGSQFGELSTSQGYSPDEQAVLRTQALEPIERDRTALNQRVLERTAARGILPTSGVHELDLRSVDRDAETRRTVAQRDLAINAINKRQTDRQAALELATLGLQIPNAQGQQAVSVANQLYQIPRNALMDSLQVINASSPQSAITPLLQQQQQDQQAQQLAQQQTAALWAQIGSILAGLEF